MRMTQGSAPIWDQAPENFDSLPAILSVIGPKLVPVMGAPEHAGVFSLQSLCLAESQASREGNRGRLGSFSGFACCNLANPSEVGLFGVGSESST